MKGMIFTELLELVEQQWGLSMVEQIIEKANLKHQGAYTSVGTYPHTEAVALVVALHEKTGIPVPDLLKTYGRYLFSRLASAYPMLLAGIKDSFDLLANIEQHIHVEVKKLYPDANPPMFICERLAPNQLKMVYQSHRQMEDIAEGLLLGCSDHFNQPYKIERNNEAEGITFIITKI